MMGLVVNSLRAVSGVQIGELVGFASAILTVLLMVRIVVFVEEEKHKWNVAYDNAVLMPLYSATRQCNTAEHHTVHHNSATQQNITQYTTTVQQSRTSHSTPRQCNTAEHHTVHHDSATKQNITQYTTTVQQSSATKQYTTQYTTHMTAHLNIIVQNNHATQ